jgi:cytosine/adenosine deaminase-related metal-dependent hydrolase
MIIRARLVVTMDGLPLENGAVVVSGDRFADVGKFREIAKSHPGEEIVDLGDQALLPGLINGHCHLDYTRLRGKIPRQKSFTGWIRAINAEKAKLSPDDYVQSIEDGFAEAKRFGTTTIANLTAFPELVSRIELPIRTWWFAELIDVRDPSRSDELVDRAVDFLKPQEHWGLAPHAPFTASQRLYRRCEEIARRDNILLTTHLAESREEASMFQEENGELHDFLKQIGRNMSDCVGRMPIQQMIEGDRSYLLVHVNDVSDEDLRMLKTSATRNSVVHCPRSHDYFGHPPFQFHKLRELGFNICLGTDSLASNDDLSLFAEMRAFRNEFPQVASEEVLKMVTLNPGRGLKQGDVLGKIHRDFFADLIAIPVTASKSALEEIISFDGTVGWAMSAGRISA